MKKKIAIDCREFYRGKSTGIGRFLQNYISHLPALRPDWDFLLFGDADTELPFSLPANVSFLAIPGANTQFWEQVSLPAALKREKCGLFFSPYYKTCVFTGVPSIITIHDLTNLVYPGYTRFRGIYRRVMRFYADSSAAVLTVSEYSKQDIVKLLGVAADKVFVSHNAIDPAVFYERKDAAARINKLGIQEPYVLYVGNANPHKNVDGLVRAYAALPEALRAGRSLVLAGVGDYAAPAGVDPGSLVKLARVPSEDLPFLYSAAQVFVFPSFYEGFGLPPVEAMACGAPVASSGASSLPEILGDACVYFDPASEESIRQALTALLSDEAARKSARLKGLEQAKKYEPGAAAGRLLGLFEKILTRGH
ncbi:MAG: glycosyltransferase family 4 protein [Elusimicrobia bacterium]|nr:glycosyltransferase family 4 protein [Elusimicrobiota bacterium]